MQASASEPAKKHIKSLREYIDALRSLGDIQDVEREVDWDLEIGAITRRVYETGSPAPLFNRVKGFSKGFRVLDAPAATSRQEGLHLARVALSLGLNPHASGQEMVHALSVARGRKGIPPSAHRDRTLQREHHGWRQCGLTAVPDTTYSSR
jgi:UbiD family decarboxylase